MTRKPFVKKLADPIYRRHIYLAVGEQKGSLRKLEKVLGFDEGYLEYDRRRVGSVWSLQEGPFIIWFPKLGYNAFDLDTMMHEVFHLTFAALDSVGLKLSDTSEEAFAYYAGYMTGQIVDAVKKYK